MKLGDMELDSVVCCDNAKGMKRLPDGCIDLVVTSPPYDSLRKYLGFSFDLDAVSKELYRVVKKGGVVVWVVNDQTVNGSETGTSFRQALKFMEVGFNLNDSMIWKKTNPMPQVKQPRYAQCFEYMFIFSKGAPKTFNPIMRKCSTSGRHYTSTMKNMDGESGRRKADFYINNQTIIDNIWDIPCDRNKDDFLVNGKLIRHPAVFPEKLARNHIVSWSNEGDVVLDPFCGSGTTLKVAAEENRHYIGFEISEEYCELSRQRVMLADRKIKGL